MKPDKTCSWFTKGIIHLLRRKKQRNKILYSENIRKEIVCKVVNAVWRKVQIACGESKAE